MARDIATAPRRSRALPASRAPGRPSRLRLWLRRRRGWLRPAGLGLLGLGGLVAVGMGVVVANPAGRLAALWEGATDLTAGAGLTVQEIVLEGRHNAPLDLIREAIAVHRGDPILSFDPHATKERLEMIAWIESASVERHLSGSIRIRVEERRPFAFWQHAGRIAVIDQSGQVVATENIGQFGRLPLVVGTGAERAAAGMVALMHTAPLVMDRTHALVRVAERRWNLKLRNGADVLLPEGQEAAALARLSELQQRQGLMDRPLAAIDLRLPDKLVLRTPAGGQAAPQDPTTAGQPPSLQRVRSNAAPGRG